MNINDKLRAKMNSGDPDVKQMVKIAEKVGFIIDFKNKKYKVLLDENAVIEQPE